MNCKHEKLYTGPTTIMYTQLGFANESKVYVKKCKASIVMCTYATKSFDIDRGQEIIYQNPLSCLNDNIVYSVFSQL